MKFRRYKEVGKAYPRSVTCRYCSRALGRGSDAIVSGRNGSDPVGFHTECLLDLAWEMVPELEVLAPNSRAVYSEAWSTLRERALATWGARETGLTRK